MGTLIKLFLDKNLCPSDGLGAYRMPTNVYKSTSRGGQEKSWETCLKPEAWTTTMPSFSFDRTPLAGASNWLMSSILTSSSSVLDQVAM